MRPGCGMLSINGGTPIAGWFLMESSIKMNENWGYPYFRKPPYSSMKIAHRSLSNFFSAARPTMNK
jgi:hypothetical protein